MLSSLVRFSTIRLALTATCTSLLLAQAVHAEPSFTLLPVGTYVWGVSDTGVVVGEGYVLPSGMWVGFRWSKTEGVTPLPPNPNLWYSAAYAISRTGSAAVGIGGLHANRWDSAGNAVDLGAINGGTESQAYGIADNGKAIVGLSNGGGIVQAMLWTQQTGPIGLGLLPGAQDSIAYDVSNNGVVVGSSTQAFRWTKAGGLERIGPLGIYSFATAVSEDGSVVAGYTSGETAEAFRWTRATGLVGLGLLTNYPDRPNWTAAYSMTADGSTIIGETSFPEDYRGGGFIWTTSDGMRAFVDVLTNDYGLGAPVSDLTEIVPRAISPNGRYIVGMSTYGGWIFDRGY